MRTWLDHPQVQEAIREVEEELYHRAEKRMFRLFLTSIGRMDRIIRHADDKSALRAVELLWEAHGRLPRGRGREEAPPGADTYNQTQVNVLTREDAKAAMSLLRKERERLECEKLEQRDLPAE